MSEEDWFNKKVDRGQFGPEQVRKVVGFLRRVHVEKGVKTTNERAATSGKVDRDLFGFSHCWQTRRSFLKILGVFGSSISLTSFLAACGGNRRESPPVGPGSSANPASPVESGETAAPPSPTPPPTETPTPTPEDYQRLFEELRSYIVQIEGKYPEAGFIFQSRLGNQEEIDQKLRGNFFSDETQFTTQEENTFEDYSDQEKENLARIFEQYQNLESEHGYYMGVNIPSGTDFQVQVSNPTDHQTYINFRQDYNLDKEFSFQFSAIRFYKDQSGQLKVALRAENAIVGSGHDPISGSVWISMDAGSALGALQGGGQMTSVMVARSVALTGSSYQLQNAQVALSHIANNLNGYSGNETIDFLKLTEIKGVPDSEVDSLGYVWGHSLRDGQSIPEIAGGLCGGGTGGDRLARQVLKMQNIEFTSVRQVHEHSPLYPTRYIHGTADPSYRDHILLREGRGGEMEWDTTLATHSDGSVAVNATISPSGSSRRVIVDDTVLMHPEGATNGHPQGPYLLQMVTARVR